MFTSMCASDRASLKAAYEALLAKECEIRCVGRVTDLESQKASLQSQKIYKPRYEGDLKEQRIADLDRDIECAKLRYFKEAGCLGQGKVDTIAYLGKTILDLFVAKAHVGFDELLVKVYKLYTQGCDDSSQIAEVVLQVKSALVDFDKAAESVTFASLFCAIFRQTTAFSEMKKELTTLCLARFSEVEGRFEVLQAAFGLSAFVAESASVDTFSGFPERASVIRVERLFEKRKLQCQSGVVSANAMYGKAQGYDAAARQMGWRVIKTLDDIRDRERNIAELKSLASKWEEAAHGGRFLKQVVPLIERYMQPVHQMPSISLDLAPSKWKEIREDIEVCAKVREQISQCLEKHALTERMSAKIS